MNFSKPKSRHNKIFAIFTAAVIILAVVLNLLITYLGQRNTIFIDSTPEGLYTPSDKFIEECEFLNEIGKKEGAADHVEIIFCTDPDRIVANTYLRATYFTALRLSQIYKTLEVKTVDIVTNPTAVAAYKTTSLSKIRTTDVIVAYGDRYLITGAQKFWTVGSQKNLFSYNGEYKLAGMLKSVTAIDMPSAYFVTGHGESYYDMDDKTSEMSKSLSQIADLLHGRGLEIKLLDLSTVERVPDDCALLIINDPRTDFTYDKDRLDEYGYVSDTEKIDRYLISNQGAVIVNKDYRLKLPVLESFLYEWGFSFGETLVKDEVYSVNDEGDTHTQIITKYNPDETSYGYAIYGEFSKLSSAPVTVLYDTGAISCAYGDSPLMPEAGTPNANKTYLPFLTTSENAVLYGKDASGEYNAPASYAGEKDVVSLTVRRDLDTEKNEDSFSYLFCSASREFFSNDLLSNASYANYDIVCALVDNISRVDVYGSMDLGGSSLNSSSYGGKQLVSVTMTAEGSDVYSPDGKHIVRHNYGLTDASRGIYTAVIFSVPVLVAVIGIVVTIKRRYL